MYQPHSFICVIRMFLMEAMNQVGLLPKRNKDSEKNISALTFALCRGVEPRFRAVR